MKDDILNFAQRLFEDYGSYAVDEFDGRSFGPDILSKAIQRITTGSGNIFQVSEAGRSFENRSIKLITAGKGARSILLWSQMHGDESTATMAICDILNYISQKSASQEVRMILDDLNINFVPMLNPDGAQRFQRRNAFGIDLNRDALALASPESRTLKNLRDKLKPCFAFNLHDQELSSVALTQELSAIGLLAPAFDKSKSDNQTRDKAKRLASLFSKTMNLFIPGKVTRYDDTFEPRAFGDNMQKWGTSTLLVESGHIRNDEQKYFIRKLNFVGLMTSILSIGSDALKDPDTSDYDSLPFNGKRAYDIIIRNIIIENDLGEKTGADIALSSQVDTHSEPPPKLMEIGDLSGHVGLSEIDARGAKVPLESLLLNKPFDLDKYFGKSKIFGN